jgi:hypothetical protein
LRLATVPGLISINADSIAATALSEKNRTKLAKRAQKRSFEIAQHG